MMSEAIISVKNLTKSYRLYASPADRLKEVLWPWKRRHHLFHALHDVSFEVYPGEHLGIVGVNGAGKSTLLQILTGVLTPTSGEARVRGRVAALLELGAGFNAELTGRENALFQLRLAEFPKAGIPEKLREIEMFADIGEFFDQPMKIYSSGMYARVAFAASALVEPDILIVDEALAVGDARFQKKCLDRMSRMKNNGATILLVSHDIYGLKEASGKMLLLHQGRLLQCGPPEEVSSAYLKVLYPPGEDASLSLAQDLDGSPPAPAPVQKTRGDAGYVLKIDPKRATNTWGHGLASLLAVRCYGLQAPNFFQPGAEIIFELDICFDFPKLCRTARQNNLECNWKISMRMDIASGLPLAGIPGELPGFAFTADSAALVTARIATRFPSLARGNYFFSPGIHLGAWEALFPLAGYDNLILLYCDNSNPQVNGILEIGGALSKFDKERQGC